MTIGIDAQVIVSFVSNEFTASYQSVKRDSLCIPGDFTDTTSTTAKWRHGQGIALPLLPPPLLRQPLLRQPLLHQPLLRQPLLRPTTTPTNHYSDQPLLRPTTTPTNHYSDQPLLRPTTTTTSAAGPSTLTTCGKNRIALLLENFFTFLIY